MLILALSLSLILPAYAAGVVNGGFETGDFTGWTAATCNDYTGIVGSPQNGGIPLCAPTAHVTVVTPGTDPDVPVSTVHDGSYAARIGYTEDEFNSIVCGAGGCGHQAPSEILWESTITQTTTVPTEVGKGFLSFWYAIGAMGNHPYGTAAGFVVTVMLGGTTVYTAENRAYNDPTEAPGWTWCTPTTCVCPPFLPNTDGTCAYYPWTQVVVDLTAHAGESLTITFLVHGCQLAGHTAWAYLDNIQIAENPTAPPVPVGGELLPTNHLGVLAPWIALAALVALVAVTVISRKKRPTWP
jgi:hypothetical protein